MAPTAISLLLTVLSAKTSARRSVEDVSARCLVYERNRFARADAAMIARNGRGSGQNTGSSSSRQHVRGKCFANGAAMDTRITVETTFDYGEKRTYQHEGISRPDWVTSPETFGLPPRRCKEALENSEGNPLRPGRGKNPGAPRLPCLLLGSRHP